MVKKDAIYLINSLHDSISWDDMMYHIYVRQKIERGKDAARQGKTYTGKEARRFFSQFPLNATGHNF